MEHFTIDSNLTVSSSVEPSNSGPAIPSGVIGLFVGLLVLGIAVLVLIIYLRKTGRLTGVIPFKRLGRERRSSNSSSRRPLDMEPETSERSEGDQAGMSDLPTLREGTMFTIDDAETDPVDLDTQSRGTNDEYFYDEVFGKSVFEDEVTNTSMRELYLTNEQEDDEMFDVDIIINSITGTRSATASSATKT